MINEINNERRRSMNAPTHNQATITSGKEPRKTPNKPNIEAVDIIVSHTSILICFLYLGFCKSSDF
jgi:hypothetical protein